MLEEIKAKVEAIKNDIIKLRREIHKNPELSGEEKKTSALVAGMLKDNSVKVLTGVGGYGVTGLLKGREEGATIALRADMDALPIQDKKGVEYSSTVPGVMHACGHDVHTAILLGTAVTLVSLKGKLAGSVKFIFQPSEEKGTGGAKAMIKDGALENPKPSAIAALHSFPEYEAGRVGFKSGMMTASSDNFIITIKGKGGHAARPHQTIDSVLTASMVVNAMHHIVSRRIDPTKNAVISIGMIRGGTAPNVIAESVEIQGTVRTLDQSLREKMPQLIVETVKGITTAHGAGYDFNYEYGTPSVVNDGALVGFARECAVDVAGGNNVADIESPQMGAEDFSYFAEKVPGVLFRLGVGNKKKGITSPLHSSTFDVDEDSIAVGVTLMSWIAAKYLESKK
ncbi:MAG: amidohydrolase [Deltaproteobacteria bacterium]|nr:amidohydrolase [Deltaproteobacteria bacterium]